MSENGEVKVDPEILAKIDSLIKRSEDNGWNAAINECRRHLPPEYSRQLKPLYRIPS